MTSRPSPWSQRLLGDRAGHGRIGGSRTTAEAGDGTTAVDRDRPVLTGLVAAAAVAYGLPLVVESFVVDKGFRAITDAPAPTSPVVDATALVGNAALLLVCLAVVWLRRAALRRVTWALPLLLAWVAGVVGLIGVGADVPRSIVLFPALCAAVVVLRPGPGSVAAVGWVTAALAALSLAMAVVPPGVGSYVRDASLADDKFVWEHGILAGPFQTGNNLGLALAVGLPAVLALPRRWVRATALVLVVAALAWTFSRTSWIAAIGALAAGGALHALPSGRLRRGVAAGGLALAGLVAVALPLVTRSPAAWSNRGGFWMDGLSAWRERPWTGWGADYYLRVAQSDDDLGGFAFHAHNLAVQLLVTGGLLLLVLVGAAVVLAGVVAVREAGAGITWPAMSLVALLVCATFEVPLGVVDRGMYYPWVLVPLLLLLARGPSTVRPAVVR